MNDAVNTVAWKYTIHRKGNRDVTLMDNMIKTRQHDQNKTA